MAVYFISDGENVKIGKTNRTPKKRLAEFQTGSSLRLELLGSIEGHTTEERRLHAELARFRIRPRHEWFKGTPEVMAVVQRELGRANQQDESFAGIGPDDVLDFLFIHCVVFGLVLLEEHCPTWFETIPEYRKTIWRRDNGAVISPMTLFCVAGHFWTERYESMRGGRFTAAVRSADLKVLSFDSEPPSFVSAGGFLEDVLRYRRSYERFFPMVHRQLAAS